MWSDTDIRLKWFSFKTHMKGLSVNSYCSWHLSWGWWVDSVWKCSICLFSLKSITLFKSEWFTDHFWSRGGESVRKCCRGNKVPRSQRKSTPQMLKIKNFLIRVLKAQTLNVTEKPMMQKLAAEGHSLTLRWRTTQVVEVLHLYRQTSSENQQC